MGEVTNNTIHPVDIETGRLISGPYEGEVLGVCDADSQTTRIPNVKLTREEAAALREKFGLTPEKFHLDIDDNREGMSGTYCIYYANPALINDYIERMDCSLFGESALDVWVGRIPFVESSRCTKVSNSLHKIAGTPTFWEKQGEFANIAAWFAVLGTGISAVATDGGRAFLKRVFGGKGPDDKNDPPKSGGGRWPEGEVVDAEWSDVKEAPKGSLPMDFSAEAGVLLLMGYGLFEAAKAAALYMLSAPAALFLIVPMPAMEESLDPNRGMPPDA